MAVQESRQFRIFDEAIGNEKSLMVVQSEGVYENTVCFRLRFCQILERFRVFETSILQYLDVVISNGYFVSFFNLSAISNIDFAFFVMEAMMKKHFPSVHLERIKNMIEYHEFYENFSEQNKSEF
jgi:hypothetical protein